MSYVQSFPPLSAENVQILVLGSMPGKRSLQENQYYAHPRNLFWPFMGQLFGCGPELDYRQRASCLVGQGLAVWDVLKACFRESSLDSDIDTQSIIPNDFAAFFKQHPQIRKVFFNGAKAWDVYQKRVRSQLPSSCDHIEYQRLPSTSPANASIPIEVKFDQWSTILNDLN